MQLLFVRSDQSVTLATSRFLGLDVCDHPMDVVTRFVTDAIDTGARFTVVPLNPHVYCTALEDPSVAGILKRSLVPLDGFGILLASKLLKQPLQYRFTGTDLMEAMIAQFARDGKSIFLLGGLHGVAHECGEIISRRFPGIRVAGILEPEFVDDAADLREDEIVEAINRSGADALFVALGAPKQEAFLHRNRERINAPVAMTVGASFDFIAQRKQRAPRWMRRRGMEWIFRVLQEPIRLGPRYAFGIPKFFWCALVRGRSIQ